MSRRIVPVCALLTRLAVAPAPAEEPAKDWLGQATFDELDRRYRKSTASRVTDGAGLAWGRSYALRAYATMHRATGDVAYLRRLLEEGEAVAALRDDRRKPPLRDVIRDRVMPAWSTPRYTKGKRYAWAVHTGMITAPIIEGLWLARDRTDAKGVLSSARRAALLKSMRFAVDTHADQWRNGSRDGEGHLHGVSLSKHLPLNMQNALGRSYVWLSRLTGEKEYARRARALLTFLENRLRRVGDAYVWSYWPPLGGPGTGFEDISHGAINVDFACLGADRGWVFTAKDVERLRRTLLGKVLAKKTPADTVGGTGTTGRYAGQIGRWLSLAEGHPAAWKRIRAWFDAHRPGPTSTGLLDVAQLLRYRPR